MVALHRPARAPAAKYALKTAKTAKTAAKQILEMAKDVAHIGPRITLPAQTLFTILIVNPAFLRVAQHFIRLRALLELQFRLGIASMVTRPNPSNSEHMR